MSQAELQALRDMLARRPTAPAPVEERRARWEQLAARFPVPDDVGFEPVAIAASGLTGAWVRTPAARPGRVVLYLHGGAFVVGSATSYREFAGRLGRAARAEVLVPDYRLAPEHPFPAALEDTLAAYRFLLDEGIEPSRIALAGDSAGGNLAVAALLEARDRGWPMPAAVGTVSAYLDLTNTKPSIQERAGRDPFVDASKMDDMVGLFAPGADRLDPRLSPFHGDPRGLPPLLLLVGEDEVLHDDSVDFAAKASAAGVEAQAEVWPGMVHVWPFFGPILEEGRQATDRLGCFLDERLAA